LTLIVSLRRTSGFHPGSLPGSVSYCDFLPGGGSIIRGGSAPRSATDATQGPRRTAIPGTLHWRPARCPL